ncbi:MAG TPA: EAL domain-containing protein [Thermoanaerobaculia bacterium]|nr:EAL domain-containing protein [Thermoanaerobaculia bacterium]
MHRLRERFLRSMRRGRTVGVETPVLRSLETTLSILRAQQEATLDGILVVDASGGVLTHNRRFLEIWGIPPEVAKNADDRELLEHAVSRVADPEAFGREVAWLYDHPFEIRSNDIVQLKDGRVLSRASVPVVSDAGTAMGRAWYFRDVTEEERAEELRSAMFRISEITNTARDLNDLYRSIHRIVGELMDATNFYIALYDEMSDLLTYPYFVDQFDERPPVPEASGRGLTWYVIQSGKPLLATPARFDELVEAGAIEPVGAPSLDWLGVPLMSGDKVAGVLVIQSYNEGVRYGEREKEILVFVSQHVASAIESKNKEAALFRSKEYSENLIKAANAIIAHLDASGRIEMMNEMAETITGLSLADVRGRKWLDVLMPPQSQRDLFEQTAFSRGRPLPPVLEFAIQTRSGEQRQISWRNNEVRENGQLVGTVCIGVDVTEKNAAEEALKESENRYRQMFENNTAVKLLIDPEIGIVIDANPAACAFYGYTEEELTSMHVWDINVLSEAEVRVEMERAASQRRNFFVFQHRTKRGIRDVEIHSGPIVVMGKTLLYSIINDITDRKLAERALLESEEKYRNIFDYASVGIYQADPEGHLVTANATLARMLGYRTVEELLERNLDEIYVDPKAREIILSEEQDGRGPTHIDVLWKKRDGTPLWVQLNAHTVKHEAGRSAHLEGFVHDITERKRAEETLHSQSAAFRASMDGIAILNGKGEFIYMNDAHAELYGYDSASEMLGNTFNMLYDEQECRRFDEEIMPRVHQHGHWRGQATGIRKQGDTFPQEVSLTPLENGGLVCVARDITERNIAEDQIRHLAYHDILTGLPNRLLFKDRLTVALSRAQRERSKLAVLFLDLDRFKSINDSLGHNAGDHLLQAAADRIQSCVRESDTVARQGGDEFTVMLPVVGSADDAVLIARKILDVLRLPFPLDSDERFITSSLGISMYPEDGYDADTLIKNADTAMYQAKGLGRDNYQIFNPLINAHTLERLALENGLRKAIERDEFRIHYQPIYNVATGRIRGMEALVRWEHPELGLIPPGRFIPLAESANLMGRIGALVLRAACLQLRKWHDKGFRSLKLAINLSVSQLQQPDLVKIVDDILREARLGRESVELEITESGAMLNPEVTIKSLHELRKLGVGISLDDFGTGHSSLSYLKRFPIDTLKIDQSFVRDVTEDAETAAIVTAIIVMARTLKLEVVAEGVEQESQRQFLLENGCELMQGFLFNKPVPSDEFEHILMSNARSLLG